MILKFGESKIHDSGTALDPRGQSPGRHGPDPAHAAGGAPPVKSSTSSRCAACGSRVAESSRFSAYWDEKERRVTLCRTCLGEIFFDILPMVTGSTRNTPCGRGSPLEEPDPWQENAIRALEEAND